jgi:hypothetical protein
VGVRVPRLALLEAAIDSKEPAMHKTSRRETPFDPSIPAGPGWEGMRVHWLADRDHGRTETTVFNVTEFPPKRWHEF